jgi:hypothetical protein
MSGRGSSLGGLASGRRAHRASGVQLTVPFRAVAEEQAWLGVVDVGVTVADGSARHNNAVGVS